MQQKLEKQEQQADNLEQFIDRVKRNSDLAELTPYALRELVKAVYVEKPDRSCGKRRKNRHDRDHACFSILNFYRLTAAELTAAFFI